MKSSVLARYDHAEDGRVIIDVAADRIESLYSNFDKSAPFIRRDLDQDLADYLVACAREIGRDPFLIRFTLAHAPDESRLSRIRSSIDGYFRYLADSERDGIANMFRRSAILFAIGVAILFVSVWLNQWLGPDRSVVSNVFGEGLTVAAWVSLWEALAVFLIEWYPHRRKIRLFDRLAAAPLQFRVAVAEGHGSHGIETGNTQLGATLSGGPVS